MGIYLCPMTLAALFRANKSFFLTYLTLLLAVGVLMLLYTKEQLIHAVNDYNSGLADQLFPYLTYLGDGGFVVAVGALVLLFNRRAGWLILSSFAISGLLSLFLKMIVFPERLRPIRYFGKSD